MPNQIHQHNITNLVPQQHPAQHISFMENQHAAYVIEANAGTGKTWTIERLYIKALLERPSLTLSQILVVTFTNDATNELKSRILNQINNTINFLIGARKNKPTEQTIASENIFITKFLSSPTEIEKAIILLLHHSQNFDNASIHTIHGFCHKILQDYPIPCTVNNSINLVVDRTAQVTEIVRNFFREHIINNPNFTNNIAQVYTALDSILDNDYTTDYIQKIVARLPKDLWIQKNGKSIAKYQVLEDANLNILQQYVRLSQNNNDIKQRQELKISALTNLLSCVNNYVIDKYNQLESTNSISFNELIELVANGTQHNPSLVTALKSQYPIAFIDEFQDTDMLQWQIFNNLYVKPQYGVLIVVGDPKQAIYRFRGADIDVYLEARETIKSNNLQINPYLELTENYRSHPNIVNFVNQLFCINPKILGNGIHYTPSIAKILPEQSTLELKTSQTAKTENSTSNDIFYDDPVQIITISGKDSGDKKRNVIQAVAYEILHLLDLDSTLTSKIAILVTKNNEAEEIIHTLKKYNINATQVKLANIFSTSTATDLYSILMAIANLSDRQLLTKAATTSILNNLTPIYKLREPQTLEYLQQEFFICKHIWEKEGILALIYHLIKTLNSSVNTSTTNTAQNTLTDRDLSNLFQLGELLHKQAKLAPNHATILHWFKLKITNSNNPILATNVQLDGNNEELIRLDNNTEQIIVTTQHKAKGLEYDILFCPYFATDDTVNQTPTANFRLPFFAAFRDHSNQPQAKLIHDRQQAEQIIHNYNSENQRLNYVALTRAKIRLYLYLIAPTMRGKNYNPLAKVSKIHELFGYVKHNPTDNSHPLFNYPNLFKDPNSCYAITSQVIKTPELLTGVVIYPRNNLTDLLPRGESPRKSPPQGEYLQEEPLREKNLKENCLQDMKTNTNNHENSNLQYLSSIKLLSQPFQRQSYSSLTYVNKTNITLINNYNLTPNSSDITDTKEIVSSNLSAADNTTRLVTREDAQLATDITYRYSLLNNLFGAKFGVFFHALCEQYPLNEINTLAILEEYNIDNKYKDELTPMVNEIFNHELMHPNIMDSKRSLKSLITLKNLKPNSCYELEFNLNITQNINLATELVNLLHHYYGANHPYTVAATTLPTIHNGFLTGFIDVVFSYDGKYYVLDYKTNALNDYTGYDHSLNLDINTNDDMRGACNTLLQENAKHHYYLQYLFYLVALKRYLESRLHLDDATHLIGGAIYYYIRGVFVVEDKALTQMATPIGVYINDGCQKLIRDLDKLFS